MKILMHDNNVSIRLRQVILTAMMLTVSVANAETAAVESDNMTARELIAGAVDQTRGISSYAEFTMVIHRPDWQRTSSLKSWTRGRKDTLIRFVAPAKDAGNATLEAGQQNVDLYAQAEPNNSTALQPHVPELGWFRFFLYGPVTCRIPGSMTMNSVSNRYR